MKKAWSFVIGIIFIFFYPHVLPYLRFLHHAHHRTDLYAVASSHPGGHAADPCFGAAVPPQWKHIVVLMFENRTYNEVIGPAPYITSLANKCATVPAWKDANPVWTARRMVTMHPSPTMQP